MSETSMSKGVELDKTAASHGEHLLELDDLTMQFGGVVALENVDLTVARGEIMGLIGPNGAGKTTIFNVITGVFSPTSGDVRFKGTSIVGRKRYQLARSGIARTFQNIRLFSNMSALDNVMVGADARHRASVPAAILHTPRYHAEQKDGREKAVELLEFVGVAGRAQQAAKNLSYGDQRRLEIARALGTQPELLLLDEPAAGFNPNEKEALLGLIRRVRDRGHTVLLIEHDMSLVMNVCDRIAVLDFGHKIADGLPSEVRNNPKVIEAYLGAPTDAA